MSVTTVEPSPQRRQHNRVHRVVVVDVVGNRAIPWQALGLLASLERRSDITAAQRQAGENFHRLFQRAALDPLRAANMARPGGGAASQDAHGSEHAKRQVSKAMLALGGAASPQGSCAWFVLGGDASLAQWATRMNWRGQAMNDQMAKGMLVVTLDTLARYWRLTETSGKM